MVNIYILRRNLLLLYYFLLLSCNNLENIKKLHKILFLLITSAKNGSNDNNYNQRFFNTMSGWESATDNMLERFSKLEAEKKEAWKIVYAKNKEVKELKEFLENKGRIVELLLKRMKYEGRFFYCFQYLCKNTFVLV